MDNDFRAFFGFEAERVVGVEDFHDGTGSRRHHGFVRWFHRHTVTDRFAGEGFIRHLLKATTSPVTGETSAAMVLALGTACGFAAGAALEQRASAAATGPVVFMALAFFRHEATIIWTLVLFRRITPDAPRRLASASFTSEESFTFRRRRVIQASIPVRLSEPPTAAMY
jgi:hypothetical protein